MRKSPFFLFTILSLCFVLACMTSVASLLVVVLGAVNIGGEVAWSYYEGLSFGLVSIALPLVGALLLAISAPVLLRQRKDVVVTAVTESVAKPAAGPAFEPTGAYLKAA